MAQQRPEFTLFVLCISFVVFGHVQVSCLSPSSPPVSNYSCTAADDTPGICMDFNNCKSLKRLIVGPRPLPLETISFLRRSVCQGPARHNVCCSTQEEQRLENRIEPVVNVDHLLPSQDSCGVDYAMDKIVGGYTTEIDQYTWLALVEYRKSSGSISVGCGASLISKRYVITAGHCVFGDVLTQLGIPIKIILGEYDKRTAIDCHRYGREADCNIEPVVIAIEEIITHPEYQPSQGTLKNDIAIIRLAEEAKFSEFVNPICLPKSDIKTQSYTNSFIAGWGTNSDVKLHQPLSLVSMASCQDAYMNSTTPGLLWDKQMCAGGQFMDACKSDSGGPFMDRAVSESNDVHWTLAGVLSFRPTPCDLPNMPAVYTKVFPYLNWIKAQIRE